jgi:predicted outer membrane repeat protein
VVESNILDCTFTSNTAYSGWGGAIFGTVSPGSVYVQRSVFTGNSAYSSYTNSGHGGAMMAASNFNVNLYDCAFTNNTVLPYMQLVPLTYR